MGFYGVFAVLLVVMGMVCLMDSVEGARLPRQLPQSAAGDNQQPGTRPDNPQQGKNMTVSLPGLQGDVRPPYDKTGDPSDPSDPRRKERPSGDDASSLCELYPSSMALATEASKMISDGAKLIKYNLVFPEYDNNPMLRNMTRSYKADEWQRVLSKHGRTLLSLAFNYDILSLTMLKFGVETLDAPVVDSPPGCFGTLSEDQKIKVARDIVIQDFKVGEGKNLRSLGEQDYACHQIVDNNDGDAEFKYQCCQQKPNGRYRCISNLAGKWINLLFVLLAGVKISFLLLGPLLLQHWVYKESIRRTDYVIRLKDELTKTILVKKVAMPGVAPQKEMRQFRKFRRIVKSIPSEEVVRVKFHKLQVQVDHKRLMTESYVPVGLLNFIFDNLFRCQIKTREPFLACCKESIFGSWAPRFLWFRLMQKSDCNISCRKYLSWGHLAGLLGGLLILVGIPVPYYARCIVFYKFEEPEINDRKDFAESIGLDIPYEHNLVHYMDPKHGLLILMYVFYVLSFLLLAAFRSCNADKFDSIAVDAIQDLRGINRFEAFRMVAAHLLLPLEKFGIFGLPIGAIYWPIAIPICLIVLIVYCIPTLYLTGRFLVQSRPTWLRKRPFPSSPLRRRPMVEKRRNLSEGVSSFETALLLDNISPEYDPSSPTKTRNVPRRSVCSRCCDAQRLLTASLSTIVGFLCLVFMVCVLIMFSEVAGFVIEIFVFTLMGAIVNASNAAKYVMLVFWMFVYSSSCYKSVYDKYLKLNSKLFSFIKEKLKEDIKDVTALREEKQRNTAFKFFDNEELESLKKRSEDIDDDSEDETVKQEHPVAQIPSDAIEYIQDKLHWRIHNLIFFVDRKDMPRIPKELFYQICSIEAPGCPGPIHQSLLTATRQLLYMVLFLIFVLIVVMSFGDVYKISSTNQLLITLAGGFLPFVIRFVIKPKTGEIDLSSYTFEGKVHHIIENFYQTWPVFDLSFTKGPLVRDDEDNDDGDDDDYHNSATLPLRPPDGGGAGSADTSSHAVIPDGSVPSRPSHENGPQPRGPATPTHVDLFITIRDESDDDNLMQEPGGHGSRMSLNSLNRPSPEDPYNPPNNPSNAMVKRIAYPEQSSMDHPDQSVSTQTGADSPWRSHMSQQVQTSPASIGRPVDLVVDFSKGGVRVRNDTEPTLEAAGANGGMPLWSKSAQYKKPGGKDESAL